MYSDTRYYYLDGLGSVVGMVDASGTLQARYGYDPYGQMVVKTGSAADGNPWRYTGAYLDSTGLYKMGARYYDPARGRFTQLDPLGHGYGYASDNPVTFTDPSGLCDTLDVEDDGSCAVGGIGGGDGGGTGTGGGLNTGDPIAVIGRLDDTAGFRGTPGYEVIENVYPEWSPEANDAWVNGIIADRRAVKVASPITDDNLIRWSDRTQMWERTQFSIELEQFYDAGYRLQGDMLIPP